MIDETRTSFDSWVIDTYRQLHSKLFVGDKFRMEYRKTVLLFFCPPSVLVVFTGVTEGMAMEKRVWTSRLSTPFLY